MAWACCYKGWYKDGKEVNGRHIRRKEKKGRPGLMWMDDAESDPRNMSVKRWRTRTFDKTEWTFAVREAKAKLTGP